MFRSETTLRVRYGETDQMAYAYYGQYATYYEVARVEGLRQLGVTYREMEEMGVMMPVLENHSKYFAPARYDDLLRIVTIIRERPGVRIRFEYEIYNESNTLIHQGETLLAFVRKDNGKPCKPPAIMMDLLDQFFK